MTLPIRVPQGFHIIAHRGASAYAPENTASAFKLAHEMGIDQVEVDTQLSADGEVVLCHDLELTRYGHGGMVVEEMNWASLADLDMGSWFSPYLYGGDRMMRLDELFEAYGDRFVYHVELKGHASELAAAVFECIQRHGLTERCIVTSFRLDALTAMRKVAPQIRMGWLIREIDELALDSARRLSLYQLCPQAAWIDAKQVEQARGTVSEVRAWGVNGSAEEVVDLIERIVASGADGMTINWPDWVSV